MPALRRSNVRCLTREFGGHRAEHSDMAFGFDRKRKQRGAEHPSHGTAASRAAPGAAPVPTSYYTPGGAYGDEGPGTLDRDSRLVRPGDPYAPAPRTAPAVPIPPVPAAVTPINDPAPVVETPGSTYGVPAPQAPTRPGSTAPPGFN